MAPPHQLWFLVHEKMASNEYRQQQITLADVKQKGISLQAILTILSLNGSPASFGYFIHSASMAAAVQILTDKAIHVTWQLYCQEDHVITIIVRDIKDPSPNSSRAPSYSLSLSERRTASGQFPAPDLPILSPVRHTSGGVDPSSLEPLAELPENEKVTVTLANGTSRTFSREYITCE